MLALILKEQNREGALEPDLTDQISHPQSKHTSEMSVNSQTDLEPCTGLDESWMAPYKDPQEWVQCFSPTLSHRSWLQQIIVQFTCHTFRVSLTVIGHCTASFSQVLCIQWGLVNSFPKPSWKRCLGYVVSPSPTFSQRKCL
jgi:hypothetical protein